eukprot:CAMPEP_0183351378 /NCGR_PEP_ID=MMETSP0164_2-20130417/24398_1 /TAXON_ID=221442 /ORGANISM="Coccolithus pelagicus ssp braarudi, Strain PLY182g" /LENGTH=185 /DNA_ID=CAMNT_0025523547 /DNA_START=96 /DNA_END=649 /DNA_ORIENTATION=+
MSAKRLSACSNHEHNGDPAKHPRMDTSSAIRHAKKVYRAARPSETMGPPSLTDLARAKPVHGIVLRLCEVLLYAVVLQCMEPSLALGDHRKRDAEEYQHQHLEFDKRHALVRLWRATLESSVSVAVARVRKPNDHAAHSLLEAAGAAVWFINVDIGAQGAHAVGRFTHDLAQQHPSLNVFLFHSP